MSEKLPGDRALLPAGLRDILPPEAELEARSVDGIMDCFAAHGYQRVEPPLLEFEGSLFAGSGAAMADYTFRLMDPDGQRMLGLRADTTPQIARLAATRLSNAPRPLRLAYAGQCLRVRGTQLQPERQLTQAGIELVGPDSAQADAEIILTAVEALSAIGVSAVSVDLTVPRLVLYFLENAQMDSKPELARALDRKDAAAISAHGGEAARILLQLLEAAGPAEHAVPAVLAIDLPPETKIHAIRMAETVGAIRRQNPDLTITLDPVEFRGYEYHTGICMTFFALGRQAELGRGGRYSCTERESATGVTLYPDVIVQIAPPVALRPRLYLPFGTSAKDAALCRSQNFATIAELVPHPSPYEEAARLNCTHLFLDGSILRVAKDNK